jgi:hypothetical protein
MENTNAYRNECSHDELVDRMAQSEDNTSLRTARNIYYCIKNGEINNFKDSDATIIAMFEGTKYGTINEYNDGKINVAIGHDKDNIVVDYSEFKGVKYVPRDDCTIYLNRDGRVSVESFNLQDGFYFPIPDYDTFDPTKAPANVKRMYTKAEIVKNLLGNIATKINVRRDDSKTLIKEAK